jgi:hypothetical protein
MVVTTQEDGAAVSGVVRVHACAGRRAGAETGQLWAEYYASQLPAAFGKSVTYKNTKGKSWNALGHPHPRVFCIRRNLTKTS